MGQMGRGTASTIFKYIKLSYWCRAPAKNLYQIRLHRNDKKNRRGAENAESEKNRGNLNNSDTNGNDIICRKYYLNWYNLTLAFYYAKIFPSPNLRRGMSDRTG